MMDEMYVATNAEGKPASVHLRFADAYKAASGFLPDAMSHVHAVPLLVTFGALDDVAEAEAQKARERRAVGLADLFRILAEEPGDGEAEDG